MNAGKFDFVVGNPPWIRWGYLSDEYRQATLPLWKNYGLFSLKGHAARLGGGEKDFSMLFTYTASDYYLAKDGKLGFLITQEVFKSKGAGEGFRRFQLGVLPDSTYLNVTKALDLVSVQPFEGASNKTAAIILIKGEKTKYPVQYFEYKRKKGVGKIPPDLLLKQAKKYLDKIELMAHPIGKETGSWQTISSKQNHLSKLIGVNNYKARIGARVEPYGVYWLEIKQVYSEGNLLVRNLVERGKTKISATEELIENDLVYPIITGADIKRWFSSPTIYALIMQDIRTRAGYSEKIVKSKYPRTYSYLLKFKNALINRAAYKKYHEEAGHPFYSQYNIADYTFSPYKVVWKRMASDIIAAVVSQYKTPFGFKNIIPTDTTTLFATKSEEEAHYLCALINSSAIREFIKSYSSAGRGFGTPSVMEHVSVPKYDPNNHLHKQLSQISKTLHELKALGKESEVKKLEEQNDELINKLYNIHNIN
jgi:hypothetical protein